MTKRTFAILFTLGVLLSAVGYTQFGTTATAAKTDDAIVLTADNHVAFSSAVTYKSVAEAQIQLGKISKKLDKNDVIYLVIDSPGGSISAGNLFIDFARSLPQQIKPICIYCASMGYQFFQAFGERIVYPSSTLMSHRASLGGLSGQIPGELETRLNAIKVELAQMDAAVAKRVGLTVEQYKALIHDELWLDGVSAVKTKHADTVAKIRCDESIVDATKNEVIEIPMFDLSVELTFSKCPIIPGVLNIRFSKELPKGTTYEMVRAEVTKQKRNVRMEW